MIELTIDNVHDVMIALNPANIQIVHKACHNQIHKRNAAKVGRQAFIVYGPPLSGKTTFVQENMMSGDLIVDIDAIFKSVSMLPAYDKPNDLLPNVRAVHNLLIDNIKTRYGKWNTAWVIGGYADRYKRDKMADELGAELVFMQTTREQCLERLKNDYLRSKREAEWAGYINKWFDEYVA
jgi:predicted kinase